jgi:hypothetical protein
MTASLFPPQRPLSIGEILDLAFRIFRITVVRCLSYALIAVIAAQLPNIYSLLNGRGLAQPLSRSLHDPVWVTLYVAGTLTTLLLWAAILLRQHAMATGGAVAAAEDFGVALKRLPAMVLLAVLVSAAISVWFLPGLLFSQPARAVLWVFMAVPASVVMLASSVAWTTLLLTGRGAAASLAHSWRLTSGSLWRLMGIYTVALFIVLAIYLVLGLVTLLFSVLFAHNDIALMTAAAETLVVILSAVATPFYCAMALAVFGDLVVRREGTDLAQRISAAAAG